MREAVEAAMADAAWISNDQASKALDAALAAGCLLPGMVEQVTQRYRFVGVEQSEWFYDDGAPSPAPDVEVQDLFILRGADDA